MIREAVVVAGGPGVAGIRPDAGGNAVFIGADRGALRLVRLGIRPALSVGDFDSVTEEEFLEISSSSDRVLRVGEEKDETDTELALAGAIRLEPATITLTGVTGGRLDHAQSAMHAVYRLQEKHPQITFRILDPNNELYFLRPGRHVLQDAGPYRYISFFSFGGPVTGMTLRGFRYEAENAEILPGTTLFTSNETGSGECTISFETGICLVVRSTDA
ncbi:Thiamine pyrophosphokinase [Bhargavaea cecembensis DSE10]|uniref:Thiamine diphosphokinase n=1 Tax=Bhargavaea cecembensis DSE10 TaxID=1235279 RepID=M7NK90_9BACL|nr:thiamine diphosphokinase [Bhargavaea cecembensis]EMR07561.1 Thiamine pyrophosphokinase [Bhargavaea cecembensis DSE10]